MAVDVFVFVFVLGESDTDFSFLDGFSVILLVWHFFPEIIG